MLNELKHKREMKRKCRDVNQILVSGLLPCTGERGDSERELKHKNLFRPLV